VIPMYPAAPSSARPPMTGMMPRAIQMLRLIAISSDGFSPSGPVNYSYSVAKHHDVGIHDGITMMVAEAVADLDCNGKTSYFSLSMGENPDGALYRAPGIYAEDGTE